jgi:hypothetical protein
MISISVGRKDPRPHEPVSGRVEWRLEEVPEDLELRLCWFTRGRGTEESETVAVLALGDTASGVREFSFELPGEPWSVDGPLISISWALEVVAKKQGGLALEELVVSPDRSVRKLSELSESRSAGKAEKWLKRRFPNGLLRRPGRREENF